MHRGRGVTAVTRVTDDKPAQAETTGPTTARGRREQLATASSHVQTMQLAIERLAMPRYNKLLEGKGIGGLVTRRRTRGRLHTHLSDQHEVLARPYAGAVELGDVPIVVQRLEDADLLQARHARVSAQRGAGSTLQHHRRPTAVMSMLRRMLGFHLDKSSTTLRVKLRPSISEEGHSMWHAAHCCEHCGLCRSADAA